MSWSLYNKLRKAGLSPPQNEELKMIWRVIPVTKRYGNLSTTLDVDKDFTWTSKNLVAKPDHQLVTTSQEILYLMVGS